jgi:hypothetical protein
MYLTRSDHFGVHLNKNGKPKKFTGELNTEDDILGPLTILFDMWRAQGWDIVSHGGFVTFTHHDVSGFCTYVFPRSGQKMWGILCVKPELIKDNMDRILLWDLYDAMIDETWEQLFEMTNMRTILLEPGDVL